MTSILETPRLILRLWREADRAPFAAMNADPEVMRHFPALLSREESDAAADRQAARFTEDGLCFLALERRSDGAFLGFTGLATVRFEVPFAPAVETGWRLARHAWGQGYATEAARACLAWGFSAKGLAEIVAFAVPANRRSTAVMERLGMRRDEAGDFDHPAVPAGLPLRRHVLYRLRREDWRP
ncbi:MAG TPA: GNAT family N-acetyltransferase [Paracoccaceae bacterium]|nr:GNAT family N-acetyltransferase [Paracoccaceae bacterium]